MLPEFQISPIYYGLGGEKKRCILIIYRRWEPYGQSGVKIETILDTGEQRFIPIGYPNEEELTLIENLRKTND